MSAAFRKLRDLVQSPTALRCGALVSILAAILASGNGEHAIAAERIGWACFVELLAQSLERGR